MALCLFAAAEIAIVVSLCLASTGAWVNYAIQGIVFAAILTGRSLSRACDAARFRSRWSRLRSRHCAVCFACSRRHTARTPACAIERLESELS